MTQPSRYSGMNRAVCLVLVIGFLVLSLSVGVGVSYQTRHMLREDLVNDSLAVAEQLADDSRLALLYRSPANAERAVAIAERHPDVTSVVVVDTEHKALIGTASHRADYRTRLNEMKQGTLLADHADTLVLAAPVFIKTNEVAPIDPFDLDTANGDETIQSELLGYVLLTISKQALHDTVAKTLTVILVQSAIVGLALFLTLFYLVRRITIPLEQLAAHMTHPDTSRLFRRAQVRTAVRETAVIGEAFNTMIAKFERTHALWMELNAQLEGQVAKRTKEAEKARDQAMRLNDENRVLIHSMNAKLEEERRYVGRELHDQLNANLLAMRLSLKRIRAVGRREPGSLDQARDSLNEMTDSLDNTLNILDDMYAKSRNIVRMLRPEVIDSLSLVGAIDDAVNTMGEANPDWSITLDTNGDYSSVPYDAQIALYRIAQESLNNAAKHADAKRVHISLHYPAQSYPDGILLAVEDDGKGFTPDCHGQRRGTGLISMRERALSLGGDLRLVSKPGQGTLVLVTIPMSMKSSRGNSDADT